MTGGTADFGAPPTLSGVTRDTVEYGPWTGCVQHARAPAVVAAAPPGGGCGLPGRASRGPALVVPANFGLVSGLVQGRNQGRPRGGVPAPRSFPEMGINSPHLGSEF